MAKKKNQKDIDDEIDFLTFGLEDIAFSDIFDDENVFVDGEYLRSIMPKTQNDNKLDILNDLDVECQSVMISKAKDGKYQCEFFIPQEVPGFPEYDPKEMSKMLYKRIISRGNIQGYGQKNKDHTYSLFFSWIKPKTK
jgi:hypothetical protein